MNDDEIIDNTPKHFGQQGVIAHPAAIIAISCGGLIGFESSSPMYGIVSAIAIFTMVLISLQLEKITYLLMKKNK